MLAGHQHNAFSVGEGAGSTSTLNSRIKVHVIPFQECLLGGQGERNICVCAPQEHKTPAGRILRPSPWLGEHAWILVAEDLLAGEVVEGSGGQEILILP